MAGEPGRSRHVNRKRSGAIAPRFSTTVAKMAKVSHRRPVGSKTIGWAGTMVLSRRRKRMVQVQPQWKRVQPPRAGLRLTRDRRVRLQSGRGERIALSRRQRYCVTRMETIFSEAKPYFSFYVFIVVSDGGRSADFGPQQGSDGAGFSDVAGD